MGIRVSSRWSCCLAVALCIAQPGALRGAGADGEGLATLDFRKVVKRAKGRVFPAVVFIKALRESHEAGKKETSEVGGSGVIISADGEALTNWHVVDKAVEVRCLLFDGRPFHADVLGTDKDTDLALMKLRVQEDTGPLPYAKMGDASALREGDFVMAMGAPWGMSRSVSIGIISCTRRFLPENSEYSLWLQTDCAISPGNSGGPLVNTAGEVVGINTRAILYGGDMGFAIPSDTIRIIVRQLREHKQVNWSWTGLQLQALRDFEKNIYFEGTDGVIVSGTDPESPGRRAGFLPKDRVLRINGEAVSALTAEDLPAIRRRLGMLEKMKAARFDIVRSGETVAVGLTPREKGQVEGEELDCPRWDFTVKEINQFDNPDLFFYRKEGVFVYGVKSPGNASNSGLRMKDIILKIGGKNVQTLEDVKRLHKEAIDNIDTRSRVVITLLKRGLMRQVVLDFSRDYEKE